MAAAFASERESLVAHARRMGGDGLTDGMSGNLSIRLPDMIAITPSGVPYDSMTPADIVMIGSDGGLAGATRRRASTETPMHLAVYRAFGPAAAGAVVHTHSPYVVALSATCGVLPAVHYAMAGLGGPVRVTEYARFGTGELASRAVAGLAGRCAVILGNHGALTYGATLRQAYDRARTLEWLARVYWLAAQAGTPRTLSEQQLSEVAEATSELGYGEE